MTDNDQPEELRLLLAIHAKVDKLIDDLRQFNEIMARVQKRLSCSDYRNAENQFSGPSNQYDFTNQTTVKDREKGQ